MCVTGVGTQNNIIFLGALSFVRVMRWGTIDCTLARFAWASFRRCSIICALIYLRCVEMRDVTIREKPLRTTSKATFILSSVFVSYSILAGNVAR